MTQFERFVTEGNEQLDELAKAGAMMDEGFLAEVRAEFLEQEYTQPCSLQLVSIVWWRNGKTVKSLSPS